MSFAYGAWCGGRRRPTSTIAEPASAVSRSLTITAGFALPLQLSRFRARCVSPLARRRLTSPAAFIFAVADPLWSRFAAQVFGRCIAGDGFGGNMGYFKTLIMMGVLGCATCVSFMFVTGGGAQSNYHHTRSHYPIAQHAAGMGAGG